LPGEPSVPWSRAVNETPKKTWQQKIAVSLCCSAFSSINFLMRAADYAGMRGEPRPMTNWHTSTPWPWQRTAHIGLTNQSCTAPRHLRLMAAFGLHYITHWFSS